MEKKDKTGKPTIESITRKEALKKAGKYAAFTAASMLIVLSPKDSQAASSLPQNPGGGW